VVQTWLRGPGLVGYAKWKSEMSSGEFPSSVARIHEDSLSVPSYPVQWTKYRSLHLRQQLSTLESNTSVISNSGSSPT